MNSTTLKIVLGVIVVLGIWRYARTPSIVPSAAWNALTINPSEATDPCLAKKRCVAVVVAPWCPSCKQAMPFIQALRAKAESTTDVGVAIIIGQDSKDKLEQMSEKVGGVAMLDYGDDFTRAIGIRSVPTWLVWDRDRKILNKFSSGAPYGASQEQLIKYFAENYLEVEELAK